LRLSAFAGKSVRELLGLSYGYIVEMSIRGGVFKTFARLSGCTATDAWNLAATSSYN